MDVFHVVVDTSVLRKAHFRHPDFERLLRRSRKGALKLYISYIAIEEIRTSYLDSYQETLSSLNKAFNSLKRNDHAMLFEGLPPMGVQLPSKEDVDSNSQAVFAKFLDDNKIELLTIAPEHAAEAWKLYFDASPPFDRNQQREKRRKDIPDSWILIAARSVRLKRGRHCALVGDKKLADAMLGEGFEVFSDIEALDIEVERATSVVQSAIPENGSTELVLENLRGDVFKDVDKLVLGFIEALDGPTKSDLFKALERAGVAVDIAEHEARTLALSGVLTDSSDHYLPKDREMARQAARLPVVLAHLSRII